MILCFLRQRPCRYAELRKLMPNLSDKVLSERLADLVAVGLVTKRRVPGPKRIDTYALTARARTLGDLLRDLYVWGKAHAADYGAHVEDPLARLDALQARR